MSPRHPGSIFNRLGNRRAQTPAVPERRTVDVLGSRIAYFERGSGPPILFIHGGIAPSILWERQMSILAPDARCVAVDLIGTGYSQRLLPSGPTSYGPEVHVSYLQSFISLIGIDEPLTLVLHGWGSMIGFAYAQRHPGRIRGICHMESVTRPWRSADLAPKPLDVFTRARSEVGGHFVMDTDEYFDLATRREFLTPPGKAVLDEYRATLGRPAEMRRALLTGLTMVPIDGAPASSEAFVATYARWLQEVTVPKLFLRGEPGYWLVGELADEAESLPNTTVARVAGGHLLPADSPDGVGLLLGQWHRSL